MRFIVKMRNNLIAIFFTALFVVVNSAPSILMAINDTVDISKFYGFCENEEENTENESEIFFESIFFIKNCNQSEYFLVSNNLDHTAYRFKNYSKPYLNLVSPPPQT